MQFYNSNIPIIRRSLDEGFLSQSPGNFATGAIERDYDVDPVALGDSPASLRLLSDGDAIAAYEQQEANQSSLMHMYLRGGKPAFEFLDQGQFPDCWSHSTPHTIMLDRLKQGLPVVRLNGVAVATLLKQLNGGWCGLSMKFAREHGYPPIGNGPGEWPYQSRRGVDSPELRAAMALHKNTGDWYDMGRREYDQVLTKQQIVTLSSQNVPMAADWMIHGHSMCLVRAVRIDNAWHPLVLNSWKGFGYFGLAVLYNQWPNNAVGLRSSTASS